MNKHIEKLNEIINNQDCSWETASSEVYSHLEYVTGFPLFIEDILHYMTEDLGKLNIENYNEGRYLILKHKEQIDNNLKKILMESNLKERLFENINDIENFKKYM